MSSFADHFGFNGFFSPDGRCGGKSDPPAPVDDEVDPDEMAAEVSTPPPVECRPFIDEFGMKLRSHLTFDRSRITFSTPGTVWEVDSFIVKDAIPYVRLVPITPEQQVDLKIPLSNMRLYLTAGDATILNKNPGVKELKKPETITPNEQATKAFKDEFGIRIGSTIKYGQKQTNFTIKYFSYFYEVGKMVPRVHFKGFLRKEDPYAITIKVGIDTFRSFLENGNIEIIKK